MPYLLTLALAWVAAIVCTCIFFSAAKRVSEGEDAEIADQLANAETPSPTNINLFHAGDISRG